MREIHIDLSSDNYSQQPKVFGGYAGEHNESKLLVKLPDRMVRDDIDYYYFEFQTVLEEHITSPNVYKNNLSNDNEISIILWEQLLPFAGNLKFCINAINIGENGAVTIKGKTSVFTLRILESPTGENVLIDPKSSKEELQKSIDSALKEARDSGEFKGDKGDKGDPFTYEDFTPEQLADLKGDPGVYYGTEEPTDPSHPLWINPENDANGEIIGIAKETAELTAQATLSSWVEEGTWTPTLMNIPLVGETSAVQPTYTTEYAYCNFYTIGNLVFINCDAKFIVTAEGRGYGCIGGLPYTLRSRYRTSLSVGEVYGCIEGTDSNGYTGANEPRRIRINNNNSYAEIYSGSGAAALKFKSGYDSGGKYENCLWIKFSGVYRIA